jgi:hypothetical protein
MKRCLKTLLHCLAGLSALLVIAWTAEGAESEITIQNTALQKMLMDQLFTDRGRYILMRQSRCQFAYLASPLVAIVHGRVGIRSQVTGQLGMEVSGKCSGTGDTFDVTVSGRPYFSGEKLGLTDIRVDDVSNEMYRIVLQQFLEVTLPKALEINLRKGVQQVIAEQKSSYDVIVHELLVTNLTAENNQIRAKLSFALSAR